MARPKNLSPYQPPKDVTKNLVTFRCLPGYGWYVVGHSQAKKMGKRFYAIEGMTCARGHVAPMSVEKIRCVKCLVIDKRNKPGVTHETKEEAHEFWRQKLKLPRRDLCPEKPRFVYVVENMPYTSLDEAAAMTGLAKGVITYRCKNDEFLDYHQIATKFTMWEQIASID